MTTRTANRAMLIGLGSGVSLWALGILGGMLVPQWVSTHTHQTALNFDPAQRNTVAYFSIVNSGIEDTLVQVTHPEWSDISLHQSILTADTVQMVSQRGLLLSPHRRQDLAPGGSHIMINNLPRDLLEGDQVTLDLHFASGQVHPITFDVLANYPDNGTRINFSRVGEFQVMNAWIRATQNNSGQGLLADDTGYTWQLPPNFPIPRVPSNNPMSDAKVELGRYLFYDTRLSANQTQSCSSCHLQEKAFTDGLALAVGSTGETHPRNSQTLANVAYNATLTWANPNLQVLERQVVIPMFGEHPIELGITGHEDEVLARFVQDSLYQTMFREAFPNENDPITFGNMALALSTFLRTMISGNSPYDQYIRGDRDAMSESAIRGMALFLSETFECHHCHTGFNFSLSTVTANSTFDDKPFFNTGLYNIDGQGGYPKPNTGVHEITNRPEDMGRFRPPTLRNIALTAPYMHDGSIATLEDVIEFYSNGGRNIESGEYVGDGRLNPYKSGFVPGFEMTDQEKDDIIAFLRSLTDESFITDPRFANPFETP